MPIIFPNYILYKNLTYGNLEWKTKCCSIMYLGYVTAFNSESSGLSCMVDGVNAATGNATTHRHPYRKFSDTCILLQTQEHDQNTQQSIDRFLLGNVIGVSENVLHVYLHMALLPLAILVRVHVHTGFCLGVVEWWSKFNLQDTSSSSPILKIL